MKLIVEAYVLKTIRQHFCAFGKLSLSSTFFQIIKNDNADVKHTHSKNIVTLDLQFHKMKVSVEAIVFNF